MKISWREKSNIQVVLDQIERSVMREDGKVSFGNFNLTENEPVITSLLQFPDEISISTRSALVRSTIFEAAKKPLDKTIFLELLVANAEALGRSSEREFVLLTSMSISGLGLTKLTVDKAAIEFHHTKSPKALIRSRRALFVERRERRATEHKDYVWVSIRVKAKNVADAAEHCLRALDVLRSIICLTLNNSLSISSGEVQPINLVRLGRFHTLHETDGRAIEHTYWYDPSFVEAKVVDVGIDVRKTLVKNLKFVARALVKHRFKKQLMRSLERFVRAYDLVDHNMSIVVGWSCLEGLTLSKNVSSGDLVARRIAFLHSNPEYHRQVLDHIRIYRNSHVHEGDTNDDASITCYQLQRYMWRLVIFYFNQGRSFDSAQELTAFLDLPTDSKSLKRRRQLLNTALAYRAPPSVKTSTGQRAR